MSLQKELGIDGIFPYDEMKIIARKIREDLGLPEESVITIDDLEEDVEGVSLPEDMGLSEVILTN